ncbi:MAG TPA: hypothetical protein VLE73_01485 [Candidatus Saccharimonadales bacterium]|nr:hypothetical protein [Candidatus Saccharimonadales bacterium]
MNRDYWLRQEPGKPLFPDLEWSRPQNKQQAGKVCIAGGNLHGFAAPAEAFAETAKAGVGTARVLLPDALQKTVGRMLENGEYAPSTPSGSFSQKALGDLLACAAWADGTLIAGDLGRNAETAILLEKFLAKHQGIVTLTKDAVDYVTAAPDMAINRERTLLVLSLSQLQRLAIATKHPKALTFSMDLLHIVEWLHDFTTTYPLHIIVKHRDHVVVAVDGRISSTAQKHEQAIWRVQAASHASVWWIQYQQDAFAALTTSQA